MAISATMHFEAADSAPEPLKIYDAVVDEMDIRANPPAGLIAHWCAPEAGGLRICDMWESAESFEQFAQAKIGPLSAKHGLKPPAIEVAPVHESITGAKQARAECGVLLRFDGDRAMLLAAVDKVNALMNVNADVPQGLAFHWSTGVAGGVRVYDLWRTRADFDAFVHNRLGPVIAQANLPQPQIEYFDVYNVLDGRAGVTA